MRSAETGNGVSTRKGESVALGAGGVMKEGGQILKRKQMRLQNRSFLDNRAAE